MAVIHKSPSHDDAYDMLTQLKPGSILAASEVDLKAQIQTATGKQMMDDLDRRIARAMTGPYNDGRLMDAVSMRVFKAENGYALVIGEKLYVCPRLEDISAALVSTIAAWELDK